MNHPSPMRDYGFSTQGGVDFPVCYSVGGISSGSTQVSSFDFHLIFSELHFIFIHCLQNAVDQVFRSTVFWGGLE